MDVRTGLTIYNKPWLIEPQAAAELLDMWEHMMVAGAEWVRPKINLPDAVLFDSSIAFAPGGEDDDFDGFEGATVAVIPLSGPMMKHDFCGAYGTQSLAALVRMASATASIQKIILTIDSPGGAVDGTELLAEAIKSSPKKTTGLISGHCCSAALWVGSQCDELFATSNTDVIGSIGVMWKMRDYTDADKKAGIVERKYVSTKSPDKNKIVDDAVQGKGKALVEEHLDPIYEMFAAAVSAARPKISATAMTGKVYLTAEATSLGIIDGVSSLSEVIKGTNKNTSKLKTTNMTLADFKAQHPAIHTEAVNEALAAERDRVGAWLAFAEVDMPAVSAGIESGKPIGQKQMVEFNQKQLAAMAKKGIEADGTENAALDTPPATGTPAADAAQVAADKKVYDEIKAAAKSYLQLS